MNNKYLSGLLAGVLTAGAMQGSGNEGKMPGLGGQQTPVAQQQSGNNLSFQQTTDLTQHNHALLFSNSSMIHFWKFRL